MIEILFGGGGVAVIGWLVGLFLKRQEKRRIRQSRFARFFGTYQGYHISTANNGKVIRTALKIYQNSDGEPEMYWDDYGAYDYKGKLECIGNTIYMDFRGTHPELVRVVCQEQLSDSFEVLPGVVAAVSGQWFPSCAKIVFVKVGAAAIPAEMSPSDVDARIYDFLSKPKNPIRVKPMSLATLDHLHEAIEEVGQTV